ncbi:MAG: TetR/AcrR family transcriptional regulator [Roseburia sp.]
MSEALREKILDATIRVFNRKGLKFTMDDVASELSMSKKTIYTVFRDKETMFLEMVDYCFDSIKESEQKVLEDESLDTVGKVRKILGVLPESYQDIDLRQLYSLKDKYPKIYRKVEERLENGWENTIALLERGMAEGKIRQIQIPILKTMLEATLEQFLQRDVLLQSQIAYNDALNEVVNILVDGILVHES